MNRSQNNNKALIPKKEKVPLKLSPAYTSEVSISNQAPQGSVIVLITCGNFSRQMTIHRPIGITPFGNDCWIITPTSDVPSLLAHEKDPSQDKKTEARRKLRIAIGEKLDLLKDGAYQGEAAKLCSSSYDAGLKVAKAHYATAQQAAHDLYIRECEAAGKLPKKDWKFGQTVNSYLPAEVKAAEEFISQKVKESPEWTAGLEIIEPDKFETRGGIYHNEPQAPFCKTKCKPEQMVDMLQEHIMSSLDAEDLKYFPAGTLNPAFEFEGEVAAGVSSPKGGTSTKTDINTKSGFVALARSLWNLQKKSSTPSVKKA